MSTEQKLCLKRISLNSEAIRSAAFKRCATRCDYFSRWVQSVALRGTEYGAMTLSRSVLKDAAQDIYVCMYFVDDYHYVAVGLATGEGFESYQRAFKRSDTERMRSVYAMLDALGREESRYYFFCSGANCDTSTILSLKRRFVGARFIHVNIAQLSSQLLDCRRDEISVEDSFVQAESCLGPLQTLHRQRCIDAALWDLVTILLVEQRAKEQRSCQRKGKFYNALRLAGAMCMRT
ncbi:MAG: hypothetical protein WC966_04305 [Bradymonadales bacterium]|jgi:hypothetical protein